MPYLREKAEHSSTYLETWNGLYEGAGTVRLWGIRWWGAYSERETYFAKYPFHFLNHVLHLWTNNMLWVWNTAQAHISPHLFSRWQGRLGAFSIGVSYRKWAAEKQNHWLQPSPGSGPAPCVLSSTTMEQAASLPRHPVITAMIY